MIAIRLLFEVFQRKGSNSVLLIQDEKTSELADNRRNQFCMFMSKINNILYRLLTIFMEIW